MAQVEAIQPAERRARASVAAVRWALGVVLVVVATVLLAVRLPDAVDSFRGSRAFDVAHSDLAGVVAGANSLDIDNEFVRQALAQLPEHANYAVLVPASPELAQKTYGVLPVTLQALPEFMREVLLPRLPVEAPGVGDYVLCYDCDTSPWDPRTQWLWNDGNGHVIGRVRR